MKKIFTKKSILGGLLLGTVAVSMLATSVMAYGTSTKGTDWYDADTNFRLSGSTTVFPIMSAALSSSPGTVGRSANGLFQNTGYTSVIADIQADGSGSGCQDIIDQACDVGMSSSNSKIKTGTTAYAVARDGIAIIVNSDVDISDISIEQVKAIYDGDTTDWSTLGGTAGAITALSRDDNSGTYASMTDNVETNWEGADGYYDSNWDLATAVGNTPGSIGYVGMGYISTLPGSCKVLTLEGYAANAQNVYKGDYPIGRYLWLLEKTSISDSDVVDNRSTADALIAYIMTRTGQNIVSDEGFVKYYVDQDVNHDNKITIGDVSKVGLKWGQTGIDPLITNEDVNQDSKITIGDVSKIGLWWGLVGSNYGNSMTSGNTLVK